MNEERLEGSDHMARSDIVLGLALSGGGFRAALFHVGVLAQMATLGLLRHVEVISTVSGGSIVGALYYLHVKQLLEDKPEGEITDQDYKGIVEKIEVDFLKAIQLNIRTRTFLNPLKNIQMWMANYSRSDRIGELYDEHFYRPVFDSERMKPIEMRDLKIRPKRDRADFHPLKHNVGRQQAKVPILLINSTCLNTGHHWRFEASTMGEPPRKDKVAQEIDKNLRLRRPPTYGDIITKQQNIEVGLAVAASACVPGIFHPLAISDLYPRDIRVQLVDGGVHDNQGIQGLLDRGCNHFIVSDASGQMRDEPDPATGIISVVARTNSIMMDRIREEELFRLLQGKDPPVALVHLRKGLSVESVSWIGPDGQEAEKPKSERLATVTSDSFGVAQEVQDLLSRVRTDLDSFTDLEAYSLMLDSYKMSEGELRGAKGINSLIPNTPTTDAPRWHFLKIGPWIANPTPPYLRQLEVASERLFKVFRLSWPLTVVTLLFILGALLGLGALFMNKIKAFLFAPMWKLLVFGALLGLGFVPWLSRTFKVLRSLRSPSEAVVRFVVRALLPALGSVIVAIHLTIFDRLFLRIGSFENLERLDTPPQN